MYSVPQSEKESLAKLDGNLPTEVNCTRRVMYTRPCLRKDVHQSGSLEVKQDLHARVIIVTLKIGEENVI